MADPIRQYVNIPRNKAALRDGIPRERAGRDIELVATVEPAKANLRVCFEIVPGPDNIDPSGKKAAFKARQLNRNGKAGLVVAGTTVRIVRTDEAGVARTKLRLSAFTGDKYTVKAYLVDSINEGKIIKKGEELETQNEFETWKRFYFQRARLKGVRKGDGRTGNLAAVRELDIGDALSELEINEKHHRIELKPVGDELLIPRYANILEKDADFKKMAAKGYASELEPFTFKSILVNQIADSKVGRITFKWIQEGEELQTLDLQTGRLLWRDETVAKKTDWLLKAEWRVMPAMLRKELRKRGWQQMPPGLVEADGVNGIQVSMNKLPQSVLKAQLVSWARTKESSELICQVRITYRYLASRTNGISWYNCVWVADQHMYDTTTLSDGEDPSTVARDVERSEKARQETLVHEFGHGLGMVPRGQPTYYTKRGHQGPHCSYPLGRKRNYTGLNGECIMFGESAGTRKAEFCEHCTPSLRTCRLKLRKLPKAWLKTR